MLGECPNSEDEANCTCADFLKAQLLHEKICDGVADCWDYSDETDCGIYQSIFQSCFPVVGKCHSIRGKLKKSLAIYVTVQLYVKYFLNALEACSFTKTRTRLR